MRVTEKGASITAWAMVHGLANLVSNNIEFDRKNVELKSEEIFIQMSAIWERE